LIEACDRSKLEVAKNVFLGKGTFSPVFKVSRREEGGGRSRCMVLKIVLPGDGGAGALDLFREQESLKKAACVGCVAQVEELFDSGDSGAAMLLADVGSEVPKSAWRQLFVTLGTLHESNFVHGDPRSANAIFLQGKVRWIDFQRFVAADVVSIKDKKRDLDIVLVLLLRQQEERDAAAVREAVRQYDGTASSFDALNNR